MKTYVPDAMLIQDDILFLANEELVKQLLMIIKLDANAVSYDFPTLWELREDNHQQLYLHIDFGTELMTIKFTEDDLESIIANLNIEALGILVGYNPHENEAENVIFITDINEGLQAVLSQN